MKTKHNSLSIVQKFIIFLSVLFFIALFDSWLFVNKAREVEFYDGLDRRLNAVKFSVLKLEYMLDMFVVAWDLEKNRIDTVGKDMAEIDAYIGELKKMQGSRFLADNDLVEDAINSMAQDWRVIKKEFLRLDKALDSDEVLLIHNTVDVNTFLFSENAESVLKRISESRTGVFSKLKMLVIKGLFVSVILTLVVSYLFFRKTLTPIRRIAWRAGELSSGESETRLDENMGGEAGAIASAFNRLLDTLHDPARATHSTSLEFDDGVKMKLLQIEALSVVSGLAGKSLASDDIFRVAAQRVVETTGADAATVYLKDESDTLRLRGASGIGVDPADGPGAGPCGQEWMCRDKAGRTRRLKVDDLPQGELKEVLNTGGFTSLIIVPVPYDMDTIGVIIAAWKAEGGVKRFADDGRGRFLEALASIIGTTTGYTNLFYDEHKRKEFLERILQQSPFGLAVFGRDGKAVMLNNMLRRFFGIDSDDNFIGKYSPFDDEGLEGTGVVPMVKESLQGRVKEAEVDYDPSTSKRYGFGGAPIKLKITSFPLYDAGGEISGVVLLYADLRADAETPNVGDGSNL